MELAYIRLLDPLTQGRLPIYMHIPDGFLNLPSAIAFWCLTMAILTLAVRKVGAETDERQVPRVGVVAAAIFAAQMLNFPVAGGTSGHLLGGTLAAVILGPWAGMLAMTAVIGLQGLLFQDGGLVVMGANIFNMGIVTVLVGYGLTSAVAGRGHRPRLWVAGMAGWISVMAAALCASIQIASSGLAAPTVIFPAMLGVHALIGVGEALLTIGALRFIAAARPELLAGTRGQAAGSIGWVVVGLMLALATTLLSPWASRNPDGLMKVAGNLDLMRRVQPGLGGPLAGYVLPGFGETALSKVAAGMVGVLVVFVVTRGIYVLTHRTGVKLQTSARS